MTDNPYCPDPDLREIHQEIVQAAFKQAVLTSHIDLEITARYVSLLGFAVTRAGDTDTDFGREVICTMWRSLFWELAEMIDSMTGPGDDLRFQAIQDLETDADLRDAKPEVKMHMKYMEAFVAAAANSDYTAAVAVVDALAEAAETGGRVAEHAICTFFSSNIISFARTAHMMAHAQADTEREERVDNLLDKLFD